ncbi:MAG: pyridoxal-phosphate dependent enzyme [Planctomycetaceae bacterium]|nr:pyridoxal-phosphate dependent enzyme [Planctomycetaceae bacterium]
MVQTATIDDVRDAEKTIRQFLDPVPLVRSYALEKVLRVAPGQRVWLKDYGWTPVGSFKVYGALNWMANNLPRIGERAVTAHSSGNFASGISYAGMCYKKRVIIVMPETAPKVKFELTASFGAEIRTYDIATDHLTGQRDALTAEIAATEQAIQASPYDDRWVIAGNGVGGLEIAAQLQQLNRKLGRFYCQVSGGGLMAGHALSIHAAFPEAEIIGVEPEGANDFAMSLKAGKRERLPKPTSICDGLLSYDVGEHNWPILQRLVPRSIAMNDLETRRAMKLLYLKHGLKTEPSGAIALAAAIQDLTFGTKAADREGDIVIVVSGRNADEEAFRKWLDV